MGVNKAKQYLENQILTAPREQLLIMLFEGALRFAEQARAKIEEKEYAGSCQLLIRAQRIMIELISSLDRNAVGEPLYANLVGLYNFVYFRFVKGNINKDVALVDEGLKILRHLRDTWVEAVDKARKDQYPEAVLIEKAGKSGPSGNLSVQG